MTTTIPIPTDATTETISTLAIDAQLLALLAQAAGNDANRAILKTVHIERGALPGTLELCATDGSLLIWTDTTPDEIPDAFPESLNVLVPKEVLAYVRKKSNKTITLTYEAGQNVCTWDIGNGTITGEACLDEYPDCKPLIPAEGSHIHETARFNWTILNKLMATTKHLLDHAGSHRLHFSVVSMPKAGATVLEICNGSDLIARALVMPCCVNHS